MTAFRYTAVDGAGQNVKGRVEAVDAYKAREQLREMALLPVSLEQAGDGATSAAQKEGGGRGLSLSRPISQKTLSLITRQLATLLANQIRIEQALATVIQQSRSARTVSVLQSVRARVIEGFSLARALAEHPRDFPQYYRASISAGEASGQLETVLTHLADHVEQRSANRQTVELALIYPAFLGLIAIAIIALLLTYVVPDIVTVYRRRETELPMLTQGLIAVSDFLQAAGIYLLLGMALAGGLLRWAMSNEATRLKIDRWITRLPLIGRFSQRKNGARFSGTLAMLVQSGVPLVSAMKVAGQVTPNRHVRARIAQAATSVSEGRSLDEALKGAECFPPMLLAMIASASRSGDLGGTLARAADSQQRELNAEVKTLVALVEPLTLLTMGGIVLLIVLAILTPIVNLNQLSGV